MSINKRLFQGGGGITLSDHYGILTWTGNGSNPRDITGLSFAPDIIMAYKFDTSGGVEVYWWSRIFGTSSVLSNGFQAQY